MASECTRIDRCFYALTVRMIGSRGTAPYTTARSFDARMRWSTVKVLEHFSNCLCAALELRALALRAFQLHSNQPCARVCVCIHKMGLRTAPARKQSPLSV